MGDIRRRFMLPAKYNNYVIHYTSISNDVIEFKNDICDASIISNTYDAKNGGEVIFNNEVTCINEEAFKDCNLLTSIKLPDTITEIGASAFHGCHRLKSVNIPSNVTHIREYAFYHCVQLDNVIIPEKCVFIGDSAFYDCWQLKTVKCEGDTAPDIGEDVFSYEYLDKIYIKWSEDGFSSYYTILDAYNERVQPYHVDSNGHTELIFYKTNDELKIDIINYDIVNTCNGWFAARPNNVVHNITEISDNAFNNADTLISIIIPDTITLIGDFAFFNCTSLTSITIPESVTEIGDSAFFNCTSLTSVTIPDSVTLIRDYAFYKCTSLTSVTIPDSVTLIRDYAFSGCTSLTYVTLPNNITRISVRLFSGCEQLTNVIIPNTVTLIDSYAFYGCTSLGKIIIPSNVTEIGVCAFEKAGGIMFINGTPTLHAGVFSSGNWRIFTDPDNVAYINNNASADYYRGGWCYPLDYTHDIIYKSSYAISGEMNTSNNIVNDISISTSAYIRKLTFNDILTEIEDEMFSGITNLLEIVYMPDTITSIGSYAFADCSSLTSVTIPDSVTSIEEFAFSGCSNLKSIDGLNNITSIGSMAFRDCTSLSSITVPETVTSIGTYAFSSCSSLTSITIPNSITSIADGAFHSCSSLTNIIIPNDVTSIGEGAFTNCGSLTHIIIPDNVISIGEWAFSNTTNLKCIILPHKLSNISDYAFHRCTSTEHIIFNENVTAIGKYAFWECNSITDVTIPDNVISIGNGAFQECASLITVNTGNGNLNTVGSNVFARCNSLLSFTGKYASSDNKCFIVNNVLNSYATSQPNSTYTIPANITDIGAYAFSECNNLTNVTISNNVVRIWEHAFSYSSLVNVDIGNSVTTIDDDVFRESTKLQTVKLGNKVGWLGDSAFYGCSSLRKIISYAPTAPSISSTTFNNVKSGGLLCYPYGSNYNSWLSTSSFYLGYYNWNSEEMSNHPLEVVFIANNGSIGRVSKYKYKSSMGRPIGIVVVPEGFAPDGIARMISLEPASTTSVTWQTSASDTALQNYSRVSITGNTDTTIEGNQVIGIIPSDAFNALQSFVDPKAYYSSSTNTKRIPSPYYNDDANPDYYAIPYGTSLNALSDFNGLGNTSILMLNRSIHPAINAIYSFNNTFPSKYGIAIDWYLPSIGELGYVMARLKEIRNLMNELGASSSPLHSQTTYLWSSTEATASAAWQISLNTGNASGMYLKTSTLNFTIPWPMAHI